MTKISPKELSERISKADIDLLVLLEKMDEENRKEKRFQLVVTTSLATIAGFFIFISYFYPDINKLTLSAISISCGISLALASTLQYKREKIKVLHKIISNLENISESEKQSAEEYRKNLMERLKEESNNA